MFDTPFGYVFSDKTEKKNKSGLDVTEHKLAFTCRLNHRYIVNVEEFPYEVFVIKFHLKSHSSSEKKYQLLTNIQDPFRVLATCTQILFDFSKQSPYASFGFIGENLEGEGKSNTKRFRVYRMLMANKFSDKEYQHLMIQKKSVYLMVNRLRHSKDPELVQKIEKMFLSIYDLEKSEG